MLLCHRRLSIRSSSIANSAIHAIVRQVATLLQQAAHTVSWDEVNSSSQIGCKSGNTNLLRVGQNRHWPEWKMPSRG